MSLKNLEEIATLVTNPLKKSRFEGGEGQSKTRQLIQGLLEKRWKTDEEAAAELYGNKLGIKTFEMLKSRTREQLLELIFQLQTETEFKSSYDRVYHLTCKNLVSGAILLLKNRLISGEMQLKLAVKSSSLYHFTDLKIVTLRLLRNIYSFMGKRKDYYLVNDDLENQIKIQLAEIRAEGLYQNLALDSVMSVADAETFRKRAETAFKEISSIILENDTYTIRNSFYRIGIFSSNLSHDYMNSIRIASDCEEYFRNHPHLSRKSRLAEMSLHKLYASLHLRDYENGSIYAIECSKLLNPGILNWLIFLEYYFLLCLHTGNYEKAAEVYRQVVMHKSFASYPPQNKEKWKIFESFLVYALPDKGKAGIRFNIARFLNEVPIFSKDKAGYNFSIIVAQLILSLKIGDYSKLVDRSEALKLYSSRYIRKEKNPRSFYFIKMIQVMIRYDFDPVKTEQVAHKFFQKLQEAHLGEQSELETLEVIPYDLLWPDIIRMLRNRKLSAEPNKKGS